MYVTAVYGLVVRPTSVGLLNAFVFLGVGFGTNADDVEVKFGDVDCYIISILDTEIVCVTQSTSMRHSVDNSGSHPQYGQHYAWNPPLVKVQVR